MYCENCGTEHEKGVDFCEKCGNKLTRPSLKDRIFHGAGKNTGSIICPNCRNEKYNKNFCVKCGYNLNDVLGYFSPKGFPSDDEYYLELNKNYFKIKRNLQTEFDSTWYEYTFLYEKIENFEITQCKVKIFTGQCLKIIYKEDFQWQSYPMKHFCDGKNSITIPINEKYASEITDILTSLLNASKD